jgi:gamma-glutamyltranspeptidase / glutathione hydrolase
MQAQGHFQMALRMHVWGQDPQTAADAPRWRVLDGREVALERGLAPETLQALQERGHELAAETPDLAFGFGGAQIVHRADGGYVGGSDPRKDGQCAGY